jgi:lipopolysaccharide export system permease protein
MFSFRIGETFEIRDAMQVAKASWLGPEFGWVGEQITQYTTSANGELTATKHRQLPLNIGKTPKDFFQVKASAQSLSYFDLKNFIAEREKSGLDWGSYLVELHSKIAFPFVIFIVPLAVLPFAVRSARSGSLAGGFAAAMAIGFSYYALHSLAVALGRAEFLPPVLAAWTANISLAVVGLALNLGAEAPDS